MQNKPGNVILPSNIQQEELINTHQSAPQSKMENVSDTGNRLKEMINNTQTRMFNVVRNKFSMALDGSQKVLTKLKRVDADKSADLELKPAETKPVEANTMKMLPQFLLDGKLAREGLSKSTKLRIHLAARGKLGLMDNMRIMMMGTMEKFNRALFGTKADENTLYRKGLLVSTAENIKNLVGSTVDFLMGKDGDKRYGLIYKIIAPAWKMLENARHKIVDKITIPFKQIGKGLKHEFTWLTRDIGSNINYFFKGQVEKFQKGAAKRKEKRDAKNAKLIAQGKDPKKTFFEKVFGLGEGLTNVSTGILGGVTNLALKRENTKMRKLMAEGKLSVEDYKEWTDTTRKEHDTEYARHEEQVAKINKYKDTLSFGAMAKGKDPELAKELEGSEAELGMLRRRSEGMSYDEMTADRARAAKQTKRNKRKLAQNKELTLDDQYKALTADQLVNRVRDDLLKRVEKEAQRQEERRALEEFELQEKQTEDTSNIRIVLGKIHDLLFGRKYNLNEATTANLEHGMANVESDLQEAAVGNDPRKSKRPWEEGREGWEYEHPTPTSDVSPSPKSDVPKINDIPINTEQPIPPKMDIPQKELSAPSSTKSNVPKINDIPINTEQPIPPKMDIPQKELSTPSPHQVSKAEIYVDSIIDNLPPKMRKTFKSMYNAIAERIPPKMSDVPINTEQPIPPKMDIPQKELSTSLSPQIIPKLDSNIIIPSQQKSEIILPNASQYTPSNIILPNSMQQHDAPGKVVLSDTQYAPSNLILPSMQNKLSNMILPNAPQYPSSNLILPNNMQQPVPGKVLSGTPQYAQGDTFTNKIVDKPTYFKHGGELGLMGEAGPEAIMPLKRMSDGNLGVETGDKDRNVTNVVVNIFNNSGKNVDNQFLNDIKDYIPTDIQDKKNVDNQFLNDIKEERFISPINDIKEERFISPNQRDMALAATGGIIGGTLDHVVPKQHDIIDSKIDHTTGFKEGSLLDMRADSKKDIQSKILDRLNDIADNTDDIDDNIDDAFDKKKGIMAKIRDGINDMEHGMERSSNDTQGLLEGFMTGGLKGGLINAGKNLLGKTVGKVGLGLGAGIAGLGVAGVGLAARRQMQTIDKFKNEGVLAGVSDMTGLDRSGDSEFDAEGNKKSGLTAAADRFNANRFILTEAGRVARGGSAITTKLISTGGKLMAKSLPGAVGKTATSVGKFVGKTAVSAGKAAAGSKIGKMLGMFFKLKPVAKLLGPEGAAKLVSTLGKKVGKSAVGKGLKFLAGPAGMAAMAAVDLSLGMAQAKRYFKLGKTDKPTMKMRIAAGLANMLNNGLLLGLVSMPWLVEMIFGILGGDREELDAQQSRVQERAAELGVDSDKLNEIENKTVGQKVTDFFRGKEKTELKDAKFLGFETVEEYRQFKTKTEEYDKKLTEPKKEETPEEKFAASLGEGTSERKSFDETGLVGGHGEFDTDAELIKKLSPEAICNEKGFNTNKVDIGTIKRVTDNGYLTKAEFSESIAATTGDAFDIPDSAKLKLTNLNFGTTLIGKWDPADVIKKHPELGKNAPAPKPEPPVLPPEPATSTTEPIPMPVTTPSKIVPASASYGYQRHGYNNLKDTPISQPTTTTIEPTPIPVTAPSKIVPASASYGYGKISDTTSTTEPTPMPVVTPSKIVPASASYGYQRHGYNNLKDTPVSQPTTTTSTTEPIPIPVATPSKIVPASASYGYSRHGYNNLKDTSVSQPTTSTTEPIAPTQSIESNLPKLVPDGFDMERLLKHDEEMTGQLIIELQKLQYNKIDKSSTIPIESKPSKIVPASASYGYQRHGYNNIKQEEPKLERSYKSVATTSESNSWRTEINKEKARVQSQDALISTSTDGNTDTSPSARVLSGTAQVKIRPKVLRKEGVTIRSGMVDSEKDIQTEFENSNNQVLNYLKTQNDKVSAGLDMDRLLKHNEEMTTRIITELRKSLTILTSIRELQYKVYKEESAMRNHYIKINPGGNTDIKTWFDNTFVGKIFSTVAGGNNANANSNTDANSAANEYDAGGS
jgi:hypothetical protein